MLAYRIGTLCESVKSRLPNEGLYCCQWLQFATILIQRLSTHSRQLLLDSAVLIPRLDTLTYRLVRLGSGAKASNASFRTRIMALFQQLKWKRTLTRRPTALYGRWLLDSVGLSWGLDTITQPTFIDNVPGRGRSTQQQDLPSRCEVSGRAVFSPVKEATSNGVIITQAQTRFRGPVDAFYQRWIPSGAASSDVRKGALGSAGPQATCTAAAVTGLQLQPYPLVLGNEL